MAEAKELPHDLLAEKTLIGCLLIDGSSFDEISDLKLVRDHFFHPKYGIVYEALADLAYGNSPIDYVTTCAKLKEKGQLEEIGGESFVIEITQDQASAANIYHYAKIVKDKASMRELVRTAMRVAEMGVNYKGQAQEFIQEVEASFFKLTNEAKSGGMVRLKDSLFQNLKELEDTSRQKGEIQGIPTGYPALDRYLLGLQPGQLVVLAARPAMGKTSLALNLAVNSCLESQLPVAIFSLEMISNELSMRVLSSRARVDSKRIRSKDLFEQDLDRIGDAAQELAGLPIYINDSGGSTVLDIQSQCRKIKAESGLGMIVIDYLQLLNTHNKALPREQQISEMSRSLKNMAKELECPVIALSQLNRSLESRPNKRPNISDLRESGAIEQDADIVMFVYRDEVYHPDTKEPGVAEIIIGKNRSGETGMAKVAWVGAYTSFENLSHAASDREEARPPGAS